MTEPASGTAIYVRISIPYKHRPDLSAEKIESSWVEVNRLKCKKLFVACVYRPPNACSDTFIDLLNDSLSKLPAGSQIVLLGDFNVDLSAKKNDNLQIANDLEQLINSPTRIGEQTRTAIDLVFVNNTHRIVESGVIHSAKNLVSPKPHLRQLNTVRIASMIRVLFIKNLKETDWNMVDFNGDVDPAVEMWNTLFTDVANRLAPI